MRRKASSKMRRTGRRIVITKVMNLKRNQTARIVMTKLMIIVMKLMRKVMRRMRKVMNRFVMTQLLMVIL